MIYQPREDSHLLAEQVEKYSSGQRVLDMGTGSGILAMAAQKAGAATVRAVDYDPEAVAHVAAQGINAVQSDLFEKIVGMFDLITFNPPYLPEDSGEDPESRLATTGGKEGDEIIVRFLEQAPKHLSEKGSILLLLSSLTPRKRIDAKLTEIKFKKKKLAGKKLFMEELEVWLISRN